MTVLDRLPFNFDRADFNRRIRFDSDSGLADELEDLLSRLLPVIRPKAVYTPVTIDRIDGDQVYIGPSRFRSSMLAQNLARSRNLFAYIATCGTEADAAFPAGDDPLVEFWVDTVKEMAVYSASASLIKEVASGLGDDRDQLASMNPGSGNADLWPLGDQKELFKLVGDVEAAIGVTLSPSCLMSPNKSISGFLFQTEEGWVSCRFCSRTDCPNRQEPSLAH